MFRYSLKNKGSFFGLFFLVYIAIATFSCFGTLNSNLSFVYENLTQQYNMHNVVINELYDSNNYDVKQSRFRTWLASQSDFEFRNFEAFDVTTNTDSYKLVNYANDYTIDMLDTFQKNKDDSKWIFDSIFHPYNLNDVVLLSQIKQTVINDVIEKQTMAEFVRSDYVNKNSNWYSSAQTLSALNNGMNLWFGMYQDVNNDLVIDAYIINKAENKVVGYRPKFLILNKKNFKSFSTLKLTDYNNNFSWKYSPENYYSTPEQSYLDKLTINLKENNKLEKENDANALNILKYNTKQDVDNYINNINQQSAKEININDLALGNKTAPTSIDVLNYFLNNYQEIKTLKIYPSKDTYNSNLFVSNCVDFLFTVKNNTKINTYILKNVNKYKPLLNRQMLFSFAANSAWSSKSNEIRKDLKGIESFVSNNPIFDYGWLANANIKKNIVNSSLWKGLKTENININSQYIKGGVKNWITNNGPNASGINVIMNEFKIVFDLSTSLGALSGIFTDPTAYGAVVSPIWLQKNNKEVFPKNQWCDFIQKANGNVPLENLIKNIPDKYKINVAATPYLILSTGITPDFMYPVISFENMVPNPKSQAIVYVGQTGYSRCFEAFQNNPREQILLGKYVGNKELSTFVSKLNNKIEINNFMSWPKGTDAVYTYDSKENKITPATLRVTFTSSLIKTVSAFSIAISLFIAIIALFVITILIRQFVVKNRQTLGIMNANGYSKSKVIYALSTLGLIPAMLGGLLGYLIGFFTNGFALNLFDTYWLLPVNSGNFSITFMILAIIIPIILFISLTLIIGAISLRGSATTLLSKTQTIKVGFVARVVNKSISKTPIMLRFRSSIMFSTFYRLLVLSFMTSLVVVSSEFMASSLNSFSITDQISSRETDYKFGIDLFTPTNEGGEFYEMDYQNIGKPFLQKGGSQNLSKGFYSSMYKNNPYLREYANVHFPGFDDSLLQFSKLDYLKYKTQVRELINFNIAGSNPWEFAQNMMPSNQANQAINSTKEINNMLMLDNRLMSLATFLNVTENNEFSKNFPNAFNATTAGNIISKNDEKHLFSPGLNLVDKDKNIKPIHIINFNDGKDLNFNNTDELCIDINKLKLTSNNILSNDINQFLLLNPTDIITTINKYYAVFPNSSILGIDGIFKPGAEKYLTIKQSNSNPNVVDIIFKKGIVTRDVLSVENVFTNRNLFVGYFYKAHETKDIQYSSEQEWNQAKQENSNKWFLDPLSNKDNPIYYEPVNETMVNLMGLNSPFINYILNYFNDPLYTKKIFRITYGIVGTDPTDEPYVYVNGNINKLNNKDTSKTPLTKYLANNDIQIIGIQENSSYINLFDLNNKKINNKLNNWDINSREIPIIINEFAAKKYGLKIGDIFNLKPTNTVDRFGSQLKLDYVSEIVKNAENYNIKVVGISQSFHNSYAYIPINAARKLIGLNIPASNTNQNDKDVYPSMSSFNGLFSKSDNPYSLTNTVGLYSPSGLYPGISSWEPISDPVFKLIKKAINEKPTEHNYKILNKALGSEYYPDKNHDVIADMKKSVGNNNNKTLVQQIAQKLSDTYGATTYQSMVMNVMAIDNSKALYSSLSETVISLEATVLTLIFVIALIVMMIMLWMILMDLMPLLALLATMGVSIWSNSLTFMCILIPTWFISAIVSGPIIWALLNIFKEFIFKGIGILLLAPFNCWAYILILLAIGGIFSIVYVLGAKKLANTNIANAIKR